MENSSSHRLDMTGDEVEILGYALRLALRNQRKRAQDAKAFGQTSAARGCQDRIARMEALFDGLDVAAANGHLGRATVEEAMGE